MRKSPNAPAGLVSSLKSISESAPMASLVALMTSFSGQALAETWNCGKDLDTIAGTNYNDTPIYAYSGIPGGESTRSVLDGGQVVTQFSTDGRTFTEMKTSLSTDIPSVSTAHFGVSGYAPSYDQAFLRVSGLDAYVIDNYSSGVWAVTALKNSDYASSYGSVDDSDGTVAVAGEADAGVGILDGHTGAPIFDSTGDDYSPISDRANDRLAMYDGNDAYWVNGVSSGGSKTLLVEDANPMGYLSADQSPVEKDTVFYVTTGANADPYKVKYCYDEDSAASGSDTGDTAPEPDTDSDTAESEEECIPVSRVTEGSGDLTNGSKVCTENGAAIEIEGSVANETGSSTFVLDSAGDKVSIEKDPALEVVVDSSSYNGNIFKSSGADENGLTTWSLTLGVAGATDSLDILEVTAGEVVGTCNGVETPYGVDRHIISSCLTTDTGDTGGADDDTGDTDNGGDSGDGEDSVVTDSAEPESGDSDGTQPDTDEQGGHHEQTARPENPEGCGGCDTEGCDTEGGDATTVGFGAFLALGALAARRRNGDEPPAQPVRVRVQ